MATEGRGCGSLYALFAAARTAELETVRERWQEAEPQVAELDGSAARRIEKSQAEGDVEAVRAETADLLFTDTDPSTIPGPVATLVRTGLYWFGYLASFVLFFRASTRDAVVRRLRWAYRTVGVDIRDVETTDGIARTVFRCPYRNLAAGRFGQRTLCHDVLDRVDDGYVTFLARHRGLDYDRPRPCTGSECCYSEVAER